MDALERLPSGDDAAWFAIPGAASGGVSRYVLSTPGTRVVCSRPEIVGCDYTDAMRAGLAAGLRSAPFRDAVLAASEARACVLHMLRGGLNFGVRGALHDAYGFNAHGSAFLSSQRERREDGRWSIREDTYRKLDIPEDAVLMIGDVVATGVTLAHGLDLVLAHLAEAGRVLRRLVFVTIGGTNLERLLASIDERLRASNPRYEGTDVVYLEGRFALVDDDTPLRIGIPGTDLVRRGGLLAPEFAALLAEEPASALERCVIYDAGSRAFDVPAYLADVRDYWTAVRDLARSGFTLRDALAERWPEDGAGTMDAALAGGDDDAAALEALCAARLAVLGGTT